MNELDPRAKYKTSFDPELRIDLLSIGNRTNSQLAEIRRMLILASTKANALIAEIKAFECANPDRTIKTLTEIRDILDSLT